MEKLTLEMPETSIDEKNEWENQDLLKDHQIENEGIEQKEEQEKIPVKKSIDLSRATYKEKPIKLYVNDPEHDPHNNPYGPRTDLFKELKTNTKMSEIKILRKIITAATPT